jgi:hypothetical protein
MIHLSYEIEKQKSSTRIWHLHAAHVPSQVPIDTVGLQVWQVCSRSRSGDTACVLCMWLICKFVSVHRAVRTS